MANKPFSGQWLRRLRLEADYTQKELATRLGIARETVIAIENEHPGTISTLEIDIIGRWWRACCGRLPETTRNDFNGYLKRFLRLK